MRRLLLAVAGLLVAAAPAPAAPIGVGTGQNAGVAMADDGTAFVGWQVNVGDPGDAVELCVLPPNARACASKVTVAFPGQGFNRSRVSVLAPAPNVVDVTVPRIIPSQDSYSYLSRSVDGGRSFGPAVRISAESYEQAVPGPNGQVALVGGPAMLYLGLVGPDGSGGGTLGSVLGEYLKAQFSDIAAQGGELVAASSDANSTQAFRLPAGANPNVGGAWQPLPGIPLGRQPELAGGPAGLVAMLEPSGQTPRGLFVQRLEGAAWTAPVPVTADSSNNDFEMVQNGSGRLSALRTTTADPGYMLDYATSTDGGRLWSSEVTVVRYGEPYPGDLEAATASDGRGIAVVDNSLDDKQVVVARFSPRSAPVASRVFGTARVQVRSVCSSAGFLSLVVEATRAGARVSPSAVLRRAGFGRARGVRRVSAQSFRARYDFTRARARIPVRLRPRSGRSRTLRLPVRRCGATR